MFANQGTITPFLPFSCLLKPCRYNIQNKSQTKIKLWHSCLPETIRNIEADLELYPSPLQVVRASLDRSLLSSPPQQRKKRKESQSYAEDGGAFVADESSSTVNISVKKRQIADKVELLVDSISHIFLL